MEKFFWKSNFKHNFPRNYLSILNYRCAARLFLRWKTLLRFLVCSTNFPIGATSTKNAQIAFNYHQSWSWNYTFLDKDGYNCSIKIWIYSFQVAEQYSILKRWVPVVREKICGKNQPKNAHRIELPKTYVYWPRFFNQCLKRRLLYL